MARTTDELVGSIIDVDPSDTLDRFITTANRVVTAVCVGSGDAYTDDDLEDIETWLAAHFYATLRGRLVVSQADTVREQVESKVDLGLANSSYGQAAMAADTFGNLAAWNNDTFNKKPVGGRRRLSVTYLGSDQRLLSDLVI